VSQVESYDKKGKKMWAELYIDAQRMPFLTWRIISILRISKR
jgi:hypothetical protein